MSTRPGGREGKEKRKKEGGTAERSVKRERDGVSSRHEKDDIAWIRGRA